MKRVLFFISLLIVFTRTFAQGRSFYFAVGPFDEVVLTENCKAAVYITGNEDENIKNTFSSKLVSAITNSKMYVAVEGTKDILALLNKELDFQRSGEVDEGQIAAIGRQLGVNYVFVVSLDKVLGCYTFTAARIIDVKTGLIVRSLYDTTNISNIEQLTTVANDISNKLVCIYMYVRSPNLIKKAAVYVSVGHDISNDCIPVLESIFITQFTKFCVDNKVVIVERSKDFLKQISSEQDYQQSGAVNDNQLCEIGRKFGVDYIVAVDLRSVMGAKLCTARIIDIESGLVRSSGEDTGDYNNFDNFAQFIKNTAMKIIKNGSGTAEGYRYVSLGYGTKWATYNIGASCAADPGKYFSWGETSPKKIYTSINSKWACKPNEKLIEKGVICEDDGSRGRFALKPEYDAATVNWGESWRMPNVFEFGDLINFCTIELSWFEGKRVLTFTSKINDKIIILPFTGYKESKLSVKNENEGRYHCSNNVEGIRTFFISETKIGFSPERPEKLTPNGYTIRPVLK